MTHLRYNRAYGDSGRVFGRSKSWNRILSRKGTVKRVGENVMEGG